MLNEIYGHTQNYSKTPFELHAHLTEVTGVVCKYLLRQRDVLGATPFAAKVFAWACALFLKMRPQNYNLEDLLLKKFPGVCPYCHGAPCVCWKSTKPTLDEERLSNAFYLYQPSAAKRTPNDFQLMFKRIYEESWGSGPSVISFIAQRLFEELAELGEAIRFAHLYPNNLENELADFFAWWFALISTMDRGCEESSPFLAENLLWSVYPGYCIACEMFPCLCRPGPVRELVSKPLPGQLDRLDRLTLVFNQAAYFEDAGAATDGKQRMSVPLTCIRIDLDNFKSVNDTFGHPAGDQALRHLAGIMKQKTREKDRIYRAGGDEFVILCPDYSKEEGLGTMRRVASELKRRPVRWVSGKGEAKEFHVTISVGISECLNLAELQRALDSADTAAYKSKSNGRDRITVEDEADEAANPGPQADG
jgi:diguanylate cyclase (GGDEF)-like protein